MLSVEEPDVLPDFFIIGAAKSGTTSLHEFLHSHPDVCMSSIKEPNFFSYKEIEAQQLYYPTKNIKTGPDYASLFSEHQTGQKKGESSVSYIFYPETATRIYNANPDSKIIAILRNPINRAVSHFNMDENLGLVKIPLKDIFYNPEKHPLHFQQYFLLGQYHTLLKRYFDIFPSEQIRIYLYEDLKSNEGALIDDLCRFLLIDARLELNRVNKANITSRPKSRFLKSLYASGTIRHTLNKIVPDSLKKVVFEKFFERNPVYKMDDTFEAQLKEFYKNEILQLEKLIKKDLQSWIT